MESTPSMSSSDEGWERTMNAPLELDCDHEPESPERYEGHYLSVLPLAMIVFYNVSGGPFGIEESVRSAGFLFSILGFLLMPLVWSVPEALVTAELSSAYPEASGGVAWVEEAFGPVAGWMAGFLGWVAGATDNAIYPVLFLDYVFELWTSESDSMNPMLRFLLLSSTTVVLGYLNWLGLEIVGNMSIVIGILSMSPFIVMFVVGSFQLDTSRWLELPSHGETQSTGLTFWSSLSSGALLWRPLLNNLFWNLNSFDSTASYAADIRDPGHVLPRAMFWAVLMTVAGYLLPLLVAIGATDSHQDDWVDGYLTDAAEEIAGPWLGGWVVFAAGVSNIALFQAELSADAFQLMGMAERGFLPKIFATRSRNGTPTYGILVGVIVIIAMGTFDLDKLIEMLNFNYAISLLMEYAAFIKLRISRPSISRPFRVPLGTIGCTFLLIPPMAGIVLIMALASHSTLLFSIAINVLGALLYYLYQGSVSPRSCWYNRLPVDNQLDEDDMENTRRQDSLRLVPSKPPRSRFDA